MHFNSPRGLSLAQAPDDVESTFTQKLRWTMGALQILIRQNPLAKGGMGANQRMLYFDSVSYPLTAPATVMLSMVPIIFLFSGTTPFAIPRLWELALAFGVTYVLIQAMM